MARPVKALKLVHPSHAREVSSESDAARLKQAGWLELAADKAVGPGAERQRRYRAKYRAAGLKSLVTWLPQDVHDTICELRLPKESLADVITRVFRSIRAKS